MKPVPCPKCGRLLQPAGVATCEGEDTPVYQCDECVVKVMFGDMPIEGALTFCLDKEGKPFDPASPDGRLPI